jgi:signal transduction histidine kinase
MPKQSTKTSEQPAEEQMNFELENVPWWRSLFAQLLLSFLAISLVPMIISSVLIIAAYRSVLRTYIPQELLAELTGDIFLQLLITIFFIFIIAAFVSALFSRNIARPVKLLILAIRKVSLGQIGVHMQVTRKDELGILAQFFNAMVDKLKEVQERTTTISRLKSQFVTVAAHQLRTPLSAVKWGLRLLLDGDIGTVNEDQHRLIERAYDTNDHMISLVNDMLSVSRIEEGRFGFAFAPIDITTLVEKILNEFVIPAEKRRIRVIFNSTLQERRTVVADEKRLYTAIGNITDNAIRYSREGGQVTVTLAQEISPTGIEFIKISIQDSGIGIPEQERDKIFSRFYRASNAIKAQTDGSGLGLFIVQNIITQHGGEIWFETRENEGTTFFITIPVKQVSMAKKAQQTAAKNFVEAV